ncbi:GYF domain-containing protein mpd2 [Psilocybe cubensis]|uniref:GYF domain-containing protein n=2 Tax=Psilocybe cubensis TaxID=181762 RepID=A0A8H7Y5J5_PSICU|nr:GYF domain-containing protein mpd2 [Psilocybe cubensis]KAH9486779.1 GYF domain-containing protein mpd2 [Psilocybe cubensis]
MVHDPTVPDGPDTHLSAAPKPPEERPLVVQQHPDHPDDVASVHSMPAVHVTAPSSPLVPAPSPVSSHAALLSTRSPVPSPLPSPSRSNTMQSDESSTSQQQRRARHRSAIEPRSSNRLSGFFNNLMHRREPVAASSREPIHEDSSQPEPAASNSELVSRSSSPQPIRPTTPPPSLPAPTLYELGLSLSALTSDLCPSHFSTPPSSGALLAPHYLLLCHAQGLDVLPLVSPPALQPYALVRRVAFKSVVVMEQRGVLVAIAGRRDGVRVYALEEVKKAIEWRIDVEVRRERDRSRRENVKKVALRNVDLVESRDSAEKTRKASLSTPPPGESNRLRTNLLRKNSHNTLPAPPSPPPVPLIPRSATPRAPKKRTKPAVQIPPNIPSIPPASSDPPPYVSPSEVANPSLQNRSSYISLRARSRGGSVSNVLAAAPSHHRTAESSRSQNDSKADWAESSDEEAIDVVAAGSSGSHLDERTSATLSSSRAATTSQIQPNVTQTLPVPVLPRNSTTSVRRNRPSNLDLSLTRSNTIPPPEPSPAPTLITLRQALVHSPSLVDGNTPNPDTPFGEVDDDDEEIEGHISLAQALLESRIPDLPPIGTMRPQEPIILTPSSPPLRPSEDTVSLSPADGANSIGRSNAHNNARRRRRWSIMISSPTTEVGNNSPPTAAVPSTATSVRSLNRFSRSRSFRSSSSHTPTPLEVLPPNASTATLPNTAAPSIPDTASIPVTPRSGRSSRFIPRIISNALNSRRHAERSPARPATPVEVGDGLKWAPGGNQSPPPKLEYVKLPGTKGALFIKAVETPKKSFLAILCGDNGEKVELFAGTYRTALGLSRTFILPDSPRSLELQLQGDDLVEVFLVFAQNVFGLEPATVRVREVRIGRAERRAARRRARETRPGEPTPAEQEPPDDETNVNVNIGISVPVASTATEPESERSGSPTLVASEHPGAQLERQPTPEPANPSPTPQSEELVMLATAQMGPYTTFQQLSFAPNFPLASIADEYIIPPTYPSFLEYKAEHESDNSGTSTNVTQTQFSPPGLPVPTPTAPSKWYYRDPKNVVHGPWKASLMQAWYKDGLLPPDLPVRREEDTEYVLLKDLRLQSVDPTQPFRVVAPLPDSATPSPKTRLVASQGDLLKPISLLEQPRHFGPPALFYSSRGGASTSIVDARGRSVLKGKFLWSADEGEPTKTTPSNKMGDIKRLEAFDVRKGSVLVAMRQGGLEAVSLGDALLNPADESRTTLPHYNPPLSSINRREPFVWRIGTPIISPQAGNLDEKGVTTPALQGSKKSSVTLIKSSNSRTDGISTEPDVDPLDEVLFLGRKEDDVYFCERNAASFRILRLSPTTYDTL